MLTFEQIKELMERAAELGLGRVEIERSGFKVRIDGRPAPAPAASAPLAPAAPAAAAPTGGASPVSDAAPASDGDEAPPSAEGLHQLTSPLIGTFYRAPKPGAAPFTEVGRRVTRGQVVCIVEAMKTMTDVKSDADGEVVEIHPENEQAVEFGQPLFSIRVDD